MVRKSVLALSVLAFTAAPAFAGASHWHIVLDHSTNKCSAMNASADAGAMTPVGKKMYKSEAAANAAMAKMKECK
jgi:hypothetical protein